MQSIPAIVATRNAANEKKAKHTKAKYGPLDSDEVYTPLNPTSFLPPTTPEPPIRAQQRVNFSIICYFICCVIIFFISMATVYSGNLTVTTLKAPNDTALSNGTITLNLPHHRHDGIPNLDYYTYTNTTSMHIHVNGGWPTADTAFHFFGCSLSFLVALWILFRGKGQYIRPLLWLFISICWLITFTTDLVKLREWSLQYCVRPGNIVIESLSNQTNYKMPHANASLVSGGCKLQTHQYLEVFICIALISSIINFIVALLDEKLSKLEKQPGNYYTMFSDDGEEGKGLVVNL